MSACPVSLPWDTLLRMELPSQAKALLLLRETRKALPKLSPEERRADPACRKFGEACCLVLEGKHDAAIALLDSAHGEIISFPGT